MNLPPPSMPTPPLLPTASRPFPHLARRVPNECQAGIQGVCRRASLTGSAGAAAGRTCCPDSPGSQRQKACCADWLVSPRPFLTGAGCPVRGLRRVGGACDVLWRVECTHRWFLYSSAIICHTGVESRSIPPSMCGSCTNIQSPPFFYILYPRCLSACLFCISVLSLTLLHFTNTLLCPTGPVWCEEQFPPKAVISRGEWTL